MSEQQGIFNNENDEFIASKSTNYIHNKGVQQNSMSLLHFLLEVFVMILFDVIIGYRAYDSYFSFAQDFVSGAISYRQLGDAMCLGKLGEQVVLRSEKAFGQIKYISNSPANAQVYYRKKKERDSAARREYKRTKSAVQLEDELFIVDIMIGGMKQNDERLR